MHRSLHIMGRPKCAGGSDILSAKGSARGQSPRGSSAEFFLFFVRRDGVSEVRAKQGNNRIT